MRTTHVSLILTVTLLVCGCAETHTLILDSNHRPPTNSVEVFKDGAKPGKAARQIAEISWKGHASEELKAEQYLIKESQKLGGDALLFLKVNAGEHISIGMFGAMGGATRDDEYLFKGKVMIYE